MKKTKQRQQSKRNIVARRSVADDTATSDDQNLVTKLESSVLALLRSRSPGTNCCPSEIPRRITSNESEWRALMPATREAAARLMEQGVLVITQKGAAVADPRNFKGPIRLKLVE